ncbi:XRE family transcriptional regulator [Geomonas sp. Red875]|uniref:XRE family transcriptional regulator n=1 Tax=Geomesophilobacter sediminis TaxID=2798584 RepID=A0A8J7M1Y1_9BACT|nr:XRE family transcriptional regulator [Geomesophilobacter sediminis]
MEESKEKVIKVTNSSGNVFEDLGLPDADELVVKSNLAMQLSSIIEKRQLSQVDAAAILGIPQPKVSMILNGKLRGFSMEKLCHFLTLFGRDVEIVVKPRRTEGKGSFSVSQSVDAR